MFDKKPTMFFLSLSSCAVLSIALIAAEVAAQTITRSPYLQLGTPSSVVVRWRTDIATGGRVRYGTDAGALTNIVDDGLNSTDHAVTLTGLSPDTRYFYSVGTTTSTLASGTDQKFITSPPAGASKPTRIWVIGDEGTGTDGLPAGAWTDPP